MTERNVKLINETKVLFYSEIDDQSAMELNALIVEAQTNSEWANVKYQNGTPPIKLNINSGGGLVTAALAISSTVKNSSVPIHTHIEGLCGSAAPLISVVGQHRSMSSDAIMVLHPMAWGGYGNKEQMEDLVVGNKKLDKICFSTLLKNSSLKKKKLKALLKRETYLTAKECLKFNLIDEVVF
jgi:ATP-dependent protease ClpP protease subunit